VILTIASFFSSLKILCTCLEFAHINWTLNCFLTTYHPSILLGALVDAGSLWPGIATTTPARGGAAIAHGFGCSSSIHLVGVGTGREGSGQETSCGKCTACLIVYYYYFLQKFWWISLEICFFFSPPSPSLLSRVSPIFSLCLRSLRVCRWI
jgi:hypothetical protein